MVQRLGRDFYRAGAEAVARRLLGQRLVHIVDGERRSGVILETEAYLGPEDKAAHSFGGRRTRRTETMYMDGGTAYVYLNYGIHHLVNIVVLGVDQPHAVLVRAVDPVEGLPSMRAARPKARADRDLCSGPGKLGAALGINLSHDGLDLTESGSLFVERVRPRALPRARVAACPRIGVDYAAEWAPRPLRFCVRDHPGLSVPVPKGL